MEGTALERSHPATHGSAGDPERTATAAAGTATASTEVAYRPLLPSRTIRGMPEPELSVTETAVRDAFRVGDYLDVRTFDDRVVRSSVLRFLLLGGVSADDGHLPALRLIGAHITGHLQLAYADVVAPLSLRDCLFDEPMDIYGATVRQVSLRRCVLPGLMAGNATFAGNLRLSNCRCTGTLQLTGSHISNALIMDGTELTAPAPADSGEPAVALDGTRLHVGADVLARHGFRCDGELRLTNAEIGGSLRWTGATLRNPNGYALFAPDLRVGAIANLDAGFTADGSISLHYAQITSRLSFERANLRGTGQTRVDLRHLQTRDLILLPSGPPAGPVDLRHARIGLLRDDPVTWPSELSLDGLTYEALADAGEVGQRLDWLRRDPQGYRPQAYGHLAAMYRGAGRDDDARAVLLAGEQHRRDTLPLAGRLWGHLQNLTVGYGYRPGRAIMCLAVLLIAGTLVFQNQPPRPAEAAKAPEFIAFAYTADLILPVVDLGQQANYHARGATAWLAYFLILAGLLFATTITAAAARRLRRT